VWQKEAGEKGGEEKLYQESEKERVARLFFAQGG